MNSLQKLTSWRLSLKSKLCAILHTEHVSKTLSTTTHCCWSVLLLQVRKGQLKQPLKRDVCLGNTLPVSHHKEGRQAAEGQGHAAVQSRDQEDLCNPNVLLSVSACPFSARLREERRQVKHLRSGTPTAILPLLPAKSLPTARSLLLPGGEQMSRHMVTAVRTLCTWHLTQSTNTAWEKRHRQVQQRLWSSPYCQNLFRHLVARPAERICHKNKAESC